MWIPLLTEALTLLLRGTTILMLHGLEFDSQFERARVFFLGGG